MKPNHKNPDFSGKNVIIFLTVLGILSGLVSALELEAQIQEPDFSIGEPGLITFQDNTLVALSDHLEPASHLEPVPQPVQKIQVLVTGYSSSPWETDDTPYITAAGTLVRDGVVANNYLDFGTKIRMPEIYGDKVFVIEDRMSWKKGNFHFDIWFPSRWQALDFGTKQTVIEVLES